ncbi:MAG: DUF4173 domain-containing protein [Clostridia bacterium]|nr:DUF4173 domain-containing protein [Clostridia bacterium]
MNDNNIKTDSLKSTLKADIFDFIIPFVSFFTVYFLTKEIIDEENYIKTSLIYLSFFIIATVYIIIKRKAFHSEAFLTGGCCLTLTAALAIHGSFYIIPLLMAFSALYCLTLAKSNLHTSGSYLYAFDLLQKAFLTPVANLFLPLTAILRSVKSLKKSKRNFGLLAGLLLAVPLLALLIFLLINSDAAFESVADSIMSKLEDIFPRFEFDLYAFAAFIFTPYIVSVLFTFKHGIDSEKGKNLRARISKLRFASNAFIGGFLGSVCLLYVIYLLSQTAYFFSAFGGKLPDGTEISLAEYARRGFFEMSAVAAINLCLIGTGAVFSKRQSENFSKIFKAIALFLCLFTMVLITTAMSKMVLYISELGLTHKRLAVSVFNIVMFLAFIFIIVRLFKKDFPYFRYISVISIVVVTVFMTVGADSVIGSYNTWAYLSGKHESIDIDLLDYDLNRYGSIKSLYKLKDDPDYGRVAKSRLDDYYKVSEAYFPRTISGYAAKRFVEENIDEFEIFFNEFGSLLDPDNIYSGMEEAEEEITEPETYISEIYFRNNSVKTINEVALYDGISSQGVLSPEKGAVFAFDDLYVENAEDVWFSLTVQLTKGYSWETDILVGDTNYFEIVDSADGGIDILPLPPVNSFEEAVDTLA